jgi:phosphoglycolate phosphatase-like HAD superfamily hydrolase
MKTGDPLQKVIAIDWDGTLSTLRQGGPRVLRTFLSQAFQDAGLDPGAHSEAIRIFVHGAVGAPSG